MDDNLNELMQEQNREVESLAQEENLPVTSTGEDVGGYGAGHNRLYIALAVLGVVGLVGWYYFRHKQTAGSAIPVVNQYETFNNQKYTLNSQHYKTLNTTNNTTNTVNESIVQQSAPRSQPASYPIQQTSPATGTTPKYSVSANNKPFAPPSALASDAQRYHLPTQIDTHGQTAYFYVGNWNGIPQIAKYSNTGSFLGTYNGPGLTPNKLGAIINGQWHPAGSYSFFNVN